MAAGMEVNDAAVSLKASARVPQQEGASYSSWELGTRSIPAGTPVRLSLDDSTWKAHFVRVARPSSSPNAVFLMAEVTLAGDADAAFRRGSVIWWMDRRWGPVCSP